jgi:thiamine biosynthesis protein ThiI
MPLTTNTILVQHGELYLKGKNRPVFLRCLHHNLKGKLRSLGITWPVQRPYGYFFVKVPPLDDNTRLERVLAALSEVAGVAWYTPAHRIPADTVRITSDSPDYELIESRVLELASDHYVPGATFRVHANRAEKRFLLNSTELERRLGSVIKKHSRWNKVNLKDPDSVFYVNVKSEGVFLYNSKRRGMGGLPVGISGRVLTLFSGGIDSPVAAYLIAKRGCSVDFVHFTAGPPQDCCAQENKVSQIVRELSKITGRSRLVLVPSSYFQVAILGRQAENELVIFRRFMTRVAERLASEQGAQALVVGDSLGQVASQTLENIVANSQAGELPILRPLLTRDKEEIVELAKRINTYQLSLKPYKDCCSILAKRPKLKPRHQYVSYEEQALLPGYEDLIDRTLEDAVRQEYKWGKRID